jgi:23S rRNA (adenine2030-N6)-methyltransferase
MHHYDHRVHAGNAGDVWKHFLLLEAADCLLTPDSSLVYAESHVGYPVYSLSARGEWEGGIGRIWPLLPSLENFSYFDILADFNPHGLERYPGSARLVRELARRKKAHLKAEIWDIDADVAAAWSEYPEASFPSFHLGDGFSGAISLLDRAAPGLLLIDPPFIHPGDVNSAGELFDRAVKSGWTVLCWHMMNMDMRMIYPTGRETRPPGCFSESTHEFSIQFSRIGLDYSGAEGCTVTAASPEDALMHRMKEKIKEFLKVMGDFNLDLNPSRPVHRPRNLFS